MMEIRYHPVRSFKGAAVLGLILLSAGLLAGRAWLRYESQNLKTSWVKEKPFLLQGDPDETKLALLNRSLRRSPWNDENHSLKATAYETAAARKSPLQIADKQRLLAQARQEIMRAIRLRPTEASYWVTLGRIAERLRDHPLAELAFRNALKLAPTDGFIQMDYGLYLLAEGEIHSAVARFILARNYSAAIDLRQLLEYVGAVTADREIWQRLVRFEPLDLKIYSGFLRSRGQSELAERILRQAENLEKIFKKQ
jgi:tetratricopeptide (TPR) repeat protein